MHLTRQPYSLFLVSSLIVVAITFIFWGESVVINIIDFTVFIDAKSILYILAILMILYWIVYRFSMRYLFSKSLAWIHIIITIGIIAYFLCTGTWYLKAKASSDSEAFILEQLMINKERLINLTSMTGLLFILGQLTFVFHLTIGLLREKR